MSNELVVTESTPIARMDIGLLQPAMSKVKLFNAVGNAVSIKDNLDKTIVVMGHMLAMVNITDDKTGEIRPTRALYFFADDGNVYITLAATVITRYVQLIEMFGEPSSWGTGIPLVFNKVAGNQNSVYYIVSIVESE